MRTVEDIARILLENLTDEVPMCGDYMNELYGCDMGNAVIHGHFDMIATVKKLQALGIIESSETE